MPPPRSEGVAAVCLDLLTSEALRAFTARERADGAAVSSAGSGIAAIESVAFQAGLQLVERCGCRT